MNPYISILVRYAPVEVLRECIADARKEIERHQTTLDLCAGVPSEHHKALEQTRSMMWARERDLDIFEAEIERRERES